MPDRPPQVVLGLLDHLTATSLDEDYAHVSARRTRGGPVRRQRPGVVALVVLAVFGVLVATAAVQTSRGAAESASSHASLVEQVTARREGLVKRRTLVQSLTREVSLLSARNRTATSRGRVEQAHVRRLGVVTGGAPTRGEGVEVVVDDAAGATSAKQQVQARDLQRLVNGLWQVGAEAISINGQRLTSLSPIRDAASAITVDFVSLRRPYTISVVGDSAQLGARLLDTAGGQEWVALRTNYGLRFDVDTEDSMLLPAATRLALRYAHQPKARR